MLKTGLMVFLVATSSLAAHAQLRLMLSKTNVQANEPITVTIQNYGYKAIHFCGVIGDPSDKVGDPFFLERRSSRKWEPVKGEEVNKELSHVSLPPGKSVEVVHHPEPRGKYRLGFSYSIGENCFQDPLRIMYTDSFEVH